MDKNHLVFLDIGFERSTAWFFIDHKFVFFNSINLGGNSITKDISNVLNINVPKCFHIINTQENQGMLLENLLDYKGIGNPDKE